MTKIPEEELRSAYCNYAQNNNAILIYKEIPVFSRSVDLVEFNVRTGLLTAVEFKIGDWKRAIKQLLEIAVCFDKLILCVPKPKTKKCADDIIVSCKNYGIGLLFWEADNNNFVNMSNAEKTVNIWQTQRNKVLEYIKEVKTNE